MYQVGTRDTQNGASPGGIDSLERVILKKTAQIQLTELLNTEGSCLDDLI